MEVRGGPSLPSRCRPTISSFPHRNHSGWTATEAAAPANRTAPQTTACVSRKLHRYFSWHPQGGSGGARSAAAPAVPQQLGQGDAAVPPPPFPEPLGWWGGGPGLRKPAGGLAGARRRRQLSSHCPFPPRAESPAPRVASCPRPPAGTFPVSAPSPPAPAHPHSSADATSTGSGPGRAAPPRLAAGGGED